MGNTGGDIPSRVDLSPAAIGGRPVMTEADAAAPLRGRTGSPRLDIRIVLFTIADGALLVALEGGGGSERLPRGLPNPADLLDTSARLIARQATDVQEQYLEQLYTLSVQADEGWTVIVSYMGLIGAAHGSAQDRGRAPGAAAAWHPITALPLLSPADRMVAEYALLRLRAKLGYTNIAFHLLPETFTLSELQQAYETILGRPLDKRNFRRRVIASGILEQTASQRREGSHRPAALYRFRAEHDPATYLTPPWADGERR